ncbi:macrophage mannose receptor 1-like, partial [Scomber scombrus]
MEKVLLSIIAASVLCVVSSHVQHQYHFVYEVKNMTEAQSYCRDKYTDLATIDDMEDVKTLTDMMDLNKMVLDEYGQALNSWRWSDRHAEVEFTNWAKGEPSNYGSGQYCTEMSDTGEWNDLPCALTRQAVCSSVRDVTFILILRPMSWTEAQSYCRANYTDLATVRNEAENQEVKNLTDGEKVWIGLFRDSWKWSDGSNSSFRYWASGEPHNNVGKEDCVAVNFNHSGGWEDWNCGYNKPFICSKDVTFILITRPMSWTEAQSYCRANYTDLATVRNEAENQEVKNLAGGQSVWIGLFRDSWKWSDGSNSFFRYWVSGEPNNYRGKKACVAMNFHRSGRWGDWNLFTAPTTEEPNWTLRPFPTSVPSASTTATTQSSISSSGSFTPSSSFPETTEQSAEIVPKHKMRVSVKMNSALDLNNPEVMEEVLKQ